MRDILYREEGVAGAVGAIFAMLIFVMVLSIYVTSYVPAQMTIYEQEYSAKLSDSLENLASAVLTLVAEDRNGSSLMTTFDLVSENVPFFTSPTYGLLNFSSYSQNEGSISLSVNYNGEASPYTLSAGGAASAISNNRYFTDEMFSFEFTSVFFNRVMTSNTSFLSAGFISPNSTNFINEPWINLTVVNIDYVPSEISSSSTVPIMVTFLYENSKVFSFKNKNEVQTITVTYSTSLYGKSFYQSVSSSLNNSGFLNFIARTNQQSSFGFIIENPDYQLNTQYVFNSVITEAYIEISFV